MKNIHDRSQRRTTMYKLTSYVVLLFVSILSITAFANCEEVNTLSENLHLDEFDDYDGCNQLQELFNSAIASQTMHDIEKYGTAISVEHSCPLDYKVAVTRKASTQFIKKAQKTTGSDEKEELLRRANRLTKQWQGLAMLGDINMDKKEYEKATCYYQDALSKINDEEATPKEPSVQIIESIFKKASEARLLAVEYIGVPVNHRSGEAEGLAMTNVRKFIPKRVPIPITFETGNSHFTSKGKAAIKDLLDYLSKESNTDTITLVGHTDSRGADDYNMTLSIARAQAVADWLKQNGFSKNITIKGMGERQALEVQEPERYTQQEIWQLNRRVELVRQ